MNHLQVDAGRWQLSDATRRRRHAVDASMPTRPPSRLTTYS